MKNISYLFTAIVLCFIVTLNASAKICEVTTHDITPSKMVLEVGTIGTITVTAKGENNCLAEGIKISATTSDGFPTTDDDYVSVSPETAITDENGQASFTVTANKIGAPYVYIYYSDTIDYNSFVSVSITVIPNDRTTGTGIYYGSLVSGYKLNKDNCL